VNEPTPEKIAELKLQFPDRELHKVEVVDGDDNLRAVIMTSPTREEYQKFVGDISKADAAKPADKIQSIRFAMEQSALAQIRWPDREEVKTLFAARPAIVEKFTEKLHEFAGGALELRSKKL